MKRSLKTEDIIYAALWTFIFIVPLIMLYTDSVREGHTIEWKALFPFWKQVALYFGIFVVHNYVLAPMLIYRHKVWLYIASTAALLAIFIAVQCADRPDDFHRQGTPPELQMKGAPSALQMEEHMPPPPHHEGEKPLHEFRPESHRPPVIIGQHDVIAIIILILMLGMNFGIKLYFRQKENQQRLIELERKNLQQQLEYLKYQINPHFLMNTLNNIHALVDFDPEQAKESIVQLSKILRFVLYEGSKQMVPLQRELLFLEDYIQLMQMRITDKVDLKVEMPEHIPDGEIPPLMLISFVENAFKHGVSYQQPSFIHISIAISNDRLSFRCENSKIPQSEDKHGGVGLENARQRLSLIYGERHSLKINDNSTYTVELTLPIK